MGSAASQGLVQAPIVHLDCCHFASTLAPLQNILHEAARRNIWKQIRSCCFSALDHSITFWSTGNNILTRLGLSGLCESASHYLSCLNSCLLSFCAPLLNHIAFWKLPIPARHIPASGPLHRLFPDMGLTPLFSQGLYKVAFPDHLGQHSLTLSP